MTRAWWQTLAFKLTVAFAFVALLALGTVGLISTRSTRSEFNSFINERAREDLAAQVQAYVQRYGTLDGFASVGRGGPRGPIDDGRGARLGQEPPRQRNVEPFVVLDARREPLGDVPAGAVTTAQRERATPVSVNGRVVAYVAQSNFAVTLDPRGQQFLQRTTNAILWATLAAIGTAVLMGLLVARALLGPLGELLNRIHAMRRGEAPAALARVRNDEFGEVLAAFHDMHASVARNQQARRQLTANIAHDLNTPLSVVSGTLEAMLDGTFKPTGERLARLLRESRHMSDLVNDLRFLALADAGELHLQRADANVAALVREAADSFSERAAHAGLTLGFEASGPDVDVPVDARRVTQVVHNLLSNAFAHTPAGGRVDVHVRTAPSGARVSVSDTGAGIAARHLPFVFDRLYRADEARAEGGSGLGLSICKSVVEAHGGEIDIVSEVGRGTTVTFTLPRAASGEFTLP